MNWDLTYLYKTKEDFIIGLKEMEELIGKLPSYQGKLNIEEKFTEYFLYKIELEEKFSKVYQYASLKSDLNKKDIEGLTDIGSCRNLLNKLAQNTSFEAPEILSIDKELILSFLEKNEKLKQFKFEIEDLYRQQKYVLDNRSEGLLATYSPLTSIGGELYSSLAVGDGKSKEIKLKDKTKVVVTQSNFRSLIMDATNPSDREKIFEAVYETYYEHKNIYAGIYNAVLKADKAAAENRGYESILDSYLFKGNIPTSVYKTLVNVASTKNKGLKKYIRLRKKYLGLKKYHTYDRFLELATSNKKYTYEEAKKTFFDSVEKFPESFKDKAHEVLKEGFVDVFEKEGKRTGAYSSSQPNLHPFILLNYSGTLDDVFTVAHEAGHSIHSMFSAENQPTMLQDYRIFVAEIASTFNEHNLLDYLMNSGSLSKDDKIALLQKAIDNITSTFYRQTLFAEYELIAHEKIEKDEPINYAVLSQIMIDLYKKYYGIDITKERYKEFVWAYIPHLFYTPFYVYQYATSFAASFKIYKDVSEGKEGAFDKYIGLLSAGGSKYPIEEAKDAGVDFTKKETFLAVVERMDYLVDELEKLLEEKE